jgi:hypothetical protein
METAEVFLPGTFSGVYADVQLVKFEGRVVGEVVEIREEDCGLSFTWRIDDPEIFSLLVYGT